jgi:hypothetical protein
LLSARYKTGKIRIVHINPTPSSKPPPQKKTFAKIHIVISDMQIIILFDKSNNMYKDMK